MTEQTYAPEDFVYVDIDAKKVVELVKWTKDGEPIPLEMPSPEGDNAKKGGRKPKKRYYPWGTYASMSKLYKLEGKKDSATDGAIALDTAIAKLQEEPFWDQ